MLILVNIFSYILISIFTFDLTPKTSCIFGVISLHLILLPVWIIMSLVFTSCELYDNL